MTSENEESEVIAQQKEGQLRTAWLKANSRQLQSQYTGEWVAVDSKGVLAHDVDMGSVVDEVVKAKKLGEVTFSFIKPEGP